MDDNKLINIDNLCVSETYTYREMCKKLNWRVHKSVSSNGAKAQLRLIECYYEIVKTNVGKCNGYYIKAKRREPLAISSVGREKTNLTIQFPTEECWERGKELIENLLKEEGIEYRVIVAKNRNR